MIDKELLAILACPATHQGLAEASAELLARVNARILRGELANVAGLSVSETIEGGLVREDGRLLYPVRDGIPVLLVEEGMSLTPDEAACASSTPRTPGSGSASGTG